MPKSERNNKRKMQKLEIAGGKCLKLSQFFNNNNNSSASSPILSVEDAELLVILSDSAGSEAAAENTENSSPIIIERNENNTKVEVECVNSQTKSSSTLNQKEASHVGEEISVAAVNVVNIVRAASTSSSQPENSHIEKSSQSPPARDHIIEYTAVI